MSARVAFAVFAAATLLVLGSRAGWAIVALVPPVAWSRAHLGRHAEVEGGVGALLGLASALVVAVR